jgi:hypothetical protein
VSEVGFKKKEATLQFILKQLKELRQHIRHVGADVKTNGVSSKTKLILKRVT